MIKDPNYPRFMTSVDGARKVVQSEVEAIALGDGWYKTKEEAEKALEAQTKPKVPKPSK